MTRVLAVGNLYPPHHYGGYELSCRDVLAGLRARGHETTVLTSDWRVPGVTEPDGGDVRRALPWYWADHVLLKPPVARRLELERVARRVLAATLADVRPDVVTVWNMGAMPLGLLADLARSRVPVVYVVEDEWPVYGPRIDPWTALCRRVPGLALLSPAGPRDLGSTGAFCFMSAALRDVVVAAGVRPRAAGVVYGGVDRAAFPPGPRPPWRGRLLCVSRLDRRKGVGAALHALAALPDCTLDVLGGGDPAERTRLARLAADLAVADRVRFAVTDRAGLAVAYREADALLFTSGWQEPFGLVPLEAMASGLPVVAMPSGGNAEYLADGVNCRVVTARDEAAAGAEIARRVGDLAADPTSRARLVAGGLATAAVLDLDAMVDAVERWIAWSVDPAGLPPADRPAPRPAPLPAPAP